MFINDKTVGRISLLNMHHILPKPEEDEDLLADDVGREDAEVLVKVAVAAFAELLELAFRHAGEGPAHGMFERRLYFFRWAECRK